MAPQVFQVLRCYKCLVFQVQQTKKSNKFECKLCGEKQSIKRHYGIGTAKDCRLHVQKLNGIRGEIDNLKESDDSDCIEDTKLVDITVQSNAVELVEAQSQKSKWLDYLNEHEHEIKTEVKTMFLNETEVVLEMPIKRRKPNFKSPCNKISSVTIDNNSRKDAVEKTSNCDTNTDTIKQINVKKNGNRDTPGPIEIPIRLRKDTNKNEPASEIVSNSKWAKFLQEEQELLEDHDNLILDSKHTATALYISPEVNEVSKNTSSVINGKNCLELFALCNDNELDSVLDI